MTRTICDICGRDVLNIANANICISSDGKRWDICDKCLASLNGWINVLRQGWDESEDQNDKT